jgi:GNAT superfamily N-acetyltransferase
MAPIMCAKCGFRGFPGLLFLEREHKVYHDEHFFGVRLRQLDRFECVGKIGNHKIFLIRPDSDPFARRRAERVSRRAIQEEIGEGGYDKPTFYADNPYQIVPAMQSHALLATCETRGVALLVIERRPRAAWFGWSEVEQAYLRKRKKAGGTAWSVAHVWVLPKFRRAGLGSAIIQNAFQGFNVEANSVGWLTPFTKAGFSLVRHFAPAGFWAAGYMPDAHDRYDRPFQPSAVINVRRSI